MAATDGRGGIPAWWFGAPAIAFVYAWVTPGLVPDLWPLPDTLPAGLDVFMRWFTGLLLGVGLVSAWQLALWARARH